MGTGLSPPLARHSIRFPSMLRANVAVLNPNLRWFGLLRVRSPLLTESISLSFPLGTLMFQFPRLLHYDYVFIIM